MTAPNFGNIQTPQFIPAPQRQNQLAEFGQLFATIVQNREQLAQQRERMAMERERLDADLEMDKLQKKEKLAKLEQDEKIIGARNIVVTEALPALASMPGGITPEAVEQERMRLIKAYGKDFGTHISTALNEGVAGLEAVRAGIAERRANVVRADVAETTKDDAIAQADLGTQRGRIDVETARIQNATAKLDNDLTRLRTQGYDVQKLAEARNFAMTSGLPWGRVAKEFGLPVKAGGLSPDFVFPVAEDKDATKAAADAQTASDLLSVASAQLTAMPDIGVGTAAYTQLTTEKFLGIPVDPLAPAFTSDKEKQLVGPYATITTNLVKLQHGARGTNFDAQQTIRQIVVRDSDPAKTKADKRLMIQLLPIVFRASASGDPVAPRIKLMLDAAQKRGVDDNILAPFRALQKRYEAQERAKPRGRSPDGVAVDPDDALIDAFAKGRP